MDTLALISYLVLFSTFTVVLGRLLRKSGQVFLDHIFDGNTQMAVATNFLLNIGFYLLCLSMMLLNIAISLPIDSLADAIRWVAVRLGICVLSVTIFHYCNLALLAFIVMIRRGMSNSTTKNSTTNNSTTNT